MNSGETDEDTVVIGSDSYNFDLKYSQYKTWYWFLGIGLLFLALVIMIIGLAIFIRNESIV